MDSITQATLGAACAELVLGRRLGNKGIAWGLLLGTLPDLDVLAYPWLDGVARLAWHRGLSHSLLFCVIGAPLFGWLIRRAHGDRLPLRLATWFAFLAFTTHVLIDCFTVYGTQLLEPFASTRVAWNNLFIIDPLFTLPMLVALLVAPWLDRGARARLRLMAVGTGLSTLYALASFGLKAVADARFDAALERDGVVARRWMSAPMPMTTLYWRCLVDEGDQFRIGHVAILDPEGGVAWRVVPRRGELVAALRGTRAFDALDWFTDGYWAARRDGKAVVVSDLRFGDVHVGRRTIPEDRPGWIFDFDILGAGADVRMRRTDFGDLGPALRHVARRALGMGAVDRAESNMAEAMAIAALKTISAAQSHCQASGVIDVDADGTGEFGFLGELTGAQPVRRAPGGEVGQRIEPPALHARFGDVRDGRVVVGGYVFQMYLPGRGGAPRAEAAAGGGVGVGVDASQAEAVWCCYAWPLLPGETGVRAFMVNQTGDILTNRNPGGRYGGDRGPEPDAAYVPGDPPPLRADMALNREGCDGLTWVVVS